jgi:SAM-dependent methyltransferase
VEPATYSETWFETFGRPDTARTKRETVFLRQVLPAPPCSVLDVPCGFGRHAEALAGFGYCVTGVERESKIAAEARRAGIEVYELDMRSLRELPGSFGAVICMWASFGWFDDATNVDVLGQMAEKTRKGGTLVLDVYDPDWSRAHEGERVIERGERRVREHRHVAGDRLQVTLDYENGWQDRFEWRLYRSAELRAVAADFGLECEAMCADYDSETTPSGASQLMQLVFRSA